MNHRVAIVREPGKSFPRCVTSHPLQHTINVANAKKQHAIYCNTLKELGLEVIYLPIDDTHPDSCFVEDNAVIHNKKALITRMGVATRRGEEVIVEKALNDFLETKRTLAPGTIEGGDVIHLPDRLICGVTQRTNHDGVNQMIKWLDVSVEIWVDPNIVHLKSNFTYLGKDTVIAAKAYTNHPLLNKMNILVVESDESYAANTLTINNSVLMPKGFPNSRTMVTEAGFEVIPLEMSEFQKCEGALTCLSLIF
ncbi:MAG: dimethylarginine dimethylaminohydrolase family protein [Promethearchaeota archaeon]